MAGKTAPVATKARKAKETPKPNKTQKQRKRERSAKPNAMPAELQENAPRERCIRPKEPSDTQVAEHIPSADYILGPSKVASITSNRMTRQEWGPPPTPINQDPTTPFKPPHLPKEERGPPYAPSLSQTRYIALRDSTRRKNKQTSTSPGRNDSRVRPKKFFRDTPAMTCLQKSRLFSATTRSPEVGPEDTVSEVGDRP